MIVGGLWFLGDRIDLAWQQHGVYRDALRIIVQRCIDLGGFARRLLKDTTHAEWGMVEGYDHRCLQQAHDMLAAAWRYEIRPPQRRFVVAPDLVSDATNERWLEWLSDETGSWVEEPAIVRAVLVILTNENRPRDCKAESSLERMVFDRFQHVPWSKWVIELYAESASP